jgi:hypothetical protein
MNYSLLTEQCLYSTDHDTEDSKAKYAILDPSTCKVNYTDVLVGWNFCRFRLYRFLGRRFHLRSGDDLDWRFQGFYRLDRIKLRGGR